MPVGDGDVCPGVGFGDLKACDEVEFFGGGVEEIEDAALVEGEDFVSLGGHGPVFSEALFGDPFDLAGVEIDAGESLVAEVEVGVVLDDDGCAHVALEFVLPGGFGCQGIVFGFDIEFECFATVCAGEDAIFMGDGCEDVHAPEGFDGVFPEYFSGIGIDGGEV